MRPVKGGADGAHEALMMALPMMALRMAWGMLCNVGHAM